MQCVCYSSAHMYIRSDSENAFGNITYTHSSMNVFAYMTLSHTIHTFTPKTHTVYNIRMPKVDQPAQ